jgi:hypothetical protein
MAEKRGGLRLETTGEFSDIVNRESEQQPAAGEIFRHGGGAGERGQELRARFKKRRANGGDVEAMIGQGMPFLLLLGLRLSLPPVVDE